MAKITPILWKGKKNKKGEHPIYLRLEAGDKRQYFSLRIYIRPSHWNPSLTANKKVRASHRRADAFNTEIRSAIKTAEDEIDRLRGLKETITPALLKASLLPSANSRFDFILYGERYADELHQLGKISTSRRYYSNLRMLRLYAGDTLLFDRLTLQFLRDYRTYQVGMLGNKESTVASTFRAIKALVNRAIKEGLIRRDDNPFINFPVPNPKSSKAKLSLAEIEAIVTLDLDEDSPIWHTRNYFLFSFYCAGVRFRDVCLLTNGNVRGGRLQYSMSKTGTPKNIVLVPAAQKIVDTYSVTDQEHDELLFPLLKSYDISDADKLHRSVASRSAIVNRLLKDIAKEAKITPDVSFHMSRHSWADYARREGWDVYKISKALGHKDLKATENYLRGFDTESIDEEMGKLFGGDP